MGATSPSTLWYLAEGATAGDCETWLLVQNPGGEPAEIGVKLQTGEGEVQGPAVTLPPPRTRRSFDLGGYVTTFDLSATATATRGVICERAVYGRTVVCLDPGIATPTTFYPGPAPCNWKANSDTGRTAYIDLAVQARSEAAAKLFHSAMAVHMRQAVGVNDGGTVVENRGATGTGDYEPVFSYDVWSKVPTFTLENNPPFADAHRYEIAESIVAGILAAL